MLREILAYNLLFALLCCSLQVTSLLAAYEAVMQTSTDETICVEFESEIAGLPTSYSNAVDYSLLNYLPDSYCNEKTETATSLELSAIEEISSQEALASFEIQANETISHYELPANNTITLYELFGNATVSFHDFLNNTTNSSPALQANNATTTASTATLCKLPDGVRLAVVTTTCRKGLKQEDITAPSALVVSAELMESFIATLSSDYYAIAITKCDLRKLENGSTFRLYRPDGTSELHLANIFLFAVPILVALIGGQWAGLLFAKEQLVKVQTTVHCSETERELSHKLMIFFCVLTVLFTAGFVALLFYYFDYVAYFIHALFCVWSTIALYFCFWPLVKLLPCSNLRIPANRLIHNQPHYSQILLALVSAGIAGLWIYVRNSCYSWMLQNFLGICVTIYIVTTVRLPNIKLLTTILLYGFSLNVGFFYYSVVEGQDFSIASLTSKDPTYLSNEQLPAVFKFPLIIGDASNCVQKYALLSFMDVILPGVFIAHMHIFDLKLRNYPRIYFVTIMFVYIAAQVVTEVIVQLTGQQHLDLICVVPALLIAVFIIACMRGEVEFLWAGKVTTRNPYVIALSTESAVKENASSQTASTHFLETVDP